MKKFDEIVKWGRIKPYFDKMYRFNTIDIETIDNELFIFGFTENDKYIYYLDDFYKRFNDFLIKCVQDKMDCLTWTRYDNTHLLKLILSKVTDKDSINKILLRIGKVSPIYSYHYRNFTITLENIIRDSMLFKIEDKTGCSRNVILYNLKNLFTDGLEQVAKDYQIDY
jgi:hypothetical protein